MSRLRMSKVVLWAGSDPSTIARNTELLRRDGFDEQTAREIAAVIAARSSRGAPAGPVPEVGDPQGAHVGG